MRTNSADYTTLDEYIIPKLSPDMQKFLESENLLGYGSSAYVKSHANLTSDYTLFPSSIISTSTCHRTQCALRALTFTMSRLRRFISGVSDGLSEQPVMDKALVEIVARYLDDANAMIHKLQSDRNDAAVASLAARWVQIQDVVLEVVALA